MNKNNKANRTVSMLKKQSSKMLMLLTASVMLSACMEDKPNDDLANTAAVEAQDTKAPARELSQVDGDKVIELSELSMENEKAKNQKATITGRIVLNDMEGGFYGFIAEDGSKYTPMELNKEHMRDGLVLELSGELMPNMITTTQYGTVFKVNSAKVIDESKAAPLQKKAVNPSDL
ncbi:hypothetical protein ISG33_03985 [Glaciecola sp. MH2013]|uniref:hypothetical protein n=1 Tax=Glaciecola sp. MH2013 TaxID=2785524 RepID=UPI00189D749E|nr:hypothetical protein [Glaciecola sp. MH2013]MBF7072557.1 hypothetical protein [Glaciecola sp. MH2013]